MTRRVIGTSVAIWVLLSGSLWASGWDPDVLVLGGILVAGAVVAFVAIDLTVKVRPATWPSRPQGSDVAVHDHERVKVLLDDLNGPQRTDTIRDALLAVLDDRLRAVHGIDRSAAPPEAVDELLTPRLLRLIDDPASPLDSVSELRSTLTDLEEL